MECGPRWHKAPERLGKIRSRPREDARPADVRGIALPVPLQSLPTTLICPAATHCLTIDAGDGIVEFDPVGTTHASTTTIAGAGTLQALACSDPQHCFAIDTVGDVYAATAPPAPPALASGSRPTLTGSTRVGRTLSASTGRWISATPPTFSYRWERCTRTCTTVRSARRRTYRLGPADRGARIEVIVTATNSGGSARATSPRTATVGAARVS
jgi:hypothetical protein